MALLGGAPFGGSRGTSPFFSPAGLDEHGTGSGRWGDYVFTQEGGPLTSAFVCRRLTFYASSARSVDDSTYGGC